MNHSSLGRKAKMTYPGKYSRYSDEEVGRALARKGYSESDFAEHSLTSRAFSSPMIVPGSALSASKEQELIQSLDAVYKAVQRKVADYSNDTEWFMGHKAKKAAKSAEMYRQRANELDAMLGLAGKVYEIRLQAESHQSRILREKLAQVQSIAEARLAQAAAALRMSVPTYEVYLRKKIEVDGDIAKVRALADIGLERARELSRLEIEQERERASIEIQRERERAYIETEAEERRQQIRLDAKERENQIEADRQDREDEAELNFGRRATILKDHETIKVLTDLIIQLEREKEEIKKSSTLTSSQRVEISLKTETILAYREQKRALEQGLYKTSNGQKPKSSSKGKTGQADDPR